MVYTWPTNTLLLRKKNRHSGCTHPVHYTCKDLLQTYFEHNQLSGWPTTKPLGTIWSQTRVEKSYYKTTKDLQGTWESLFPQTLADWKEPIPDIALYTAVTSIVPLGFRPLEHYSQSFHSSVTNSVTLPATFTSDNKTDLLYEDHIILTTKCDNVHNQKSTNFCIWNCQSMRKEGAAYAICATAFYSLLTNWFHACMCPYIRDPGAILLVNK